MYINWIQFFLGIIILILYLIFSARTEMGTKLFMRQNQERLEEISNFLQISANIATSGQPTVEQFQAIADFDYEVVINLALPTSDRAIANESEIVQSLGMEYIAIPIIWDNPTVTDLDQFLQAMDKRVLVPSSEIQKRLLIRVKRYIKKGGNMLKID